MNGNYVDPTRDRRGFTPTDLQANFMFVNIGRPIKAFREACAAQGVRVARDFPPSRTFTAASRSARWTI